MGATAKMKYGRMRGNKREVTIGTAHTDTVNSLNETINQSNQLTDENRPSSRAPSNMDVGH
jgi:hypothetical protein